MIILPKMSIAVQGLSRFKDLAALHLQLASPVALLGLNALLEIVRIDGVTYGTWEGNTLVARSYGLLDKTLLDDRIPHSEQFELVERIRLRDRNTLEDRISITDPETFTRPWDAILSYKRQPDDAFPFPEDVCLDRKNAGQPPLPR